MLLSNATSQPSVCNALINLYIEVIPTITTDETVSKLYASQSRCPTSPPPSPFPAGTPRKERALSVLVDAFAESGTQRKGQLHFLATMFGNVSGVSPTDYLFPPLLTCSQQREGREFLLSPHTTLSSKKDAKPEVALASLIPFTEHPDTIRRGGVASTIK